METQLPWQWILEYLVDIKDIGTPVLREMMTLIPNIAHLSGLHRRAALRYLEEAIATDRIDAHVIPLVAVVGKESQQTSSFPTSSDYKSLLLRVQVEAVIVHVRGKAKDWQGLSRAIDQIFPENAGDSQLQEKRAEFLSFLQVYFVIKTAWTRIVQWNREQSPEKKCGEVLEMYSLTALRQDLLKCISVEKDRLQHTFLDKLLQDVFSGTYPVSAESIGKPAYEKEESQEDFHSADGQTNSIGSEDRTIVGGRNSNAESEEPDETHLKGPVATQSARNFLKHNGTPRRKRSSTQVSSETKRAAKRMSYEHLELRQRDQNGKAITHTSAMKAMWEKGIETPPRSRLVDNEKVDVELAGDAVSVEFLNLGSDGHEEFCHKCKVGGRLLCCDGCPIAVHRKCLGYDPESFTEEEWFCPFCVQKRAAEAVTKAKEEESAARRRVLQFMASVDGANEKQHSSISKKTSQQNIEKEFAENQNYGDGEQERATVKRHASKKASSLSKEALKQVLASCRRSTSIDPYEAWINISSKGGRPARHSSTQASDKALQQNCQTRETTDELKQDTVCDGKLGNSTKPSAETFKTKEHGHTNVASSSKASPTNQPSSPIEQVNNQGQVGDGDGHDGDLEEDSESRKPESPKPQKGRRLYFRGNRFIPGMRRKPLQWTKEEENALREGVKRFSHDNGSWGFQWTRILEFGHAKFHPSRTDVDLKDKWRNLSKLSN
ncbi:hypothetical protein L7F22_058093 [Adiantum nelumboides]|nr:hypothetical protein [Adiantum nelumboides]